MTSRDKRAVVALERAIEIIERKDVVRPDAGKHKREEQAVEMAHVAYGIADAALVILSTASAYTPIELLPHAQKAVTALTHAADLCARLRDRKGFRADLHNARGRSGKRRIGAVYGQEEMQ